MDECDEESLYIVDSECLDQPMSETNKSALNALRPELENVPLKNIIAKMHINAGGFLSDCEEDDVMTNRTNLEKMHSLLKILTTKTNKDFLTFCKALESSGYQHFATELKKKAGIKCKPPKDPGPEATHKILKGKKVAYSLHFVIEKLRVPFSTVVSEFRKQVRPLSDDSYDDVVTLCQTTMAAKAHVIRLPDVPSHRKDFINHIIKLTTFFDIEMIHEVANLLQQPTLTEAVERYKADLEPLMKTTIAGLTDRCEVMSINQDSPEGTYWLVLKFPDDANVKDLYAAKDYLEKVLHVPDAKLMAFDFGCILAYFEITCTANTAKDLKRFIKHSDQLKAMGISGAFLIDHWAWGADSDDVWYTDDKGLDEPHKVWKEEEDVPSLQDALDKLTPSYTTLLQEFGCQVEKVSNRDMGGHLCIGTSIILLTKATLARRKGVSELPYVSDDCSDFIDKILDNTTTFDIEMITTLANYMKEPTLTEAVEKYEAALKPLMEASISELTEKMYQDSSAGTYKLVLKFPGNNLVQALYKARHYLERYLNIPEAELLVLPGGN